MQCMYHDPEDRQLVCIRTSTVRHNVNALVIPAVSGSHHVTCYSYTCSKHEEHGQTIAERQAGAWGDVIQGSYGKVRLCPTCGTPEDGWDARECSAPHGFHIPEGASPYIHYVGDKGLVGTACGEPLEAITTGDPDLVTCPSCAKVEATA